MRKRLTTPHFEQFLAERGVDAYRLERISVWCSRIVFQCGDREVHVSYYGAAPCKQTLPRLDLVLAELGR